ncbi:MAG: MATE family efflux transporter [Planctomycetota bacterium]
MVRDSSGARTDRAMGPSIQRGRLAGVRPWPAVLQLAWPVMLELVMNTLVGLVDATFAASISLEATDAVAVGALAHWLLTLVGMAVGAGVTATVSRAIGAGRLAAASAVVAQAIVLGALIGGALGLFGAIGAGPISRVFGAQGDAVSLATSYLVPMCIGLPAFLVLFQGVACLRATGDTLRAFQVNLGVNILNALVSYVLSGADVLGLPNPSPLKLGVLGIGMGTALAWSAGAVCILIMLGRGVHGVRLRRRRLRIDRSIIARLAFAAWPGAVIAFVNWSSHLMLMRFAGWIGERSGDEGLLGTQLLTFRLSAFVFMPTIAVGTAAATLVGQHLGARNPEESQRAMYRACVIGIAASTVICGALLAFAVPIVELLSDQPEHVHLVSKAVRAYVWCGPPLAIGMVLVSSLRGAGDVVGAMRTQLWTYLLNRPLLCWLCSGVTIPLGPLGELPNPGLMQHWCGIDPFTGLWLGLALDDATRIVPIWFRWRTGRWRRTRL